MFFFSVFFGLAGAPFFGSAGVPPLAEDPVLMRVAPAECLLFASWAGNGTPNPQSKNHTEQLFAEPEVAKFLKSFQDRYTSIIPAGGDSQQETLLPLTTLLSGRPGTLWLADVAIGPDFPLVDAAVLLRIDEPKDRTAITEILQKFVSSQDKIKVTEQPIDKHRFFRWEIEVDKHSLNVMWGFAGKYLVITVGNVPIPDLLQRARGEVPSWLATIRQRLTVPRYVSVMRLDIKELLAVVASQPGMSDFQRFLNDMGINGIEALSQVQGMDDNGCIHRLELTVAGKPQSLLELFDAPPLTAADLVTIPAAAPVAVVLQLDPAKLYDIMMEYWRKNPQILNLIEERKGAFEQQLGVRLREDLLASFGETWKITAQPGPSALINGWSISLELRDAKKLAPIYADLMKRVDEDLRNSGPGAPALEMNQFNGMDVYSLALPMPGIPVRPSWCLTDKELIVVANPDTLNVMLQGAPAPSASLASQASMTSVFQERERNLAAIHVDTRVVAETILGLLPMSGLPGDFMETVQQIPKDAILRHLQPYVGIVRRSAEGVEMVDRSTIPRAHVGAGLPTALALGLPSIHGAREAAQRTRSTNNCKQILLAMHNFASTYQSFPAGYSADEEGKPLLSWRVHLLPFLEHQQLYQQFHLDEPWDSPHNKGLIEQMPDVYHSPRSQAEVGKTTYLGVSGADGIFVKPAKGNHLGVPLQRITDGTSGTIAVVEASDDRAVIWTRPGDFAPDKNDVKKGLQGVFANGFLAGFADGSVMLIPLATAEADIRAMLTKSGGEAVQRPDAFPPPASLAPVPAAPAPAVGR